MNIKFKTIKDDTGNEIIWFHIAAVALPALILVGLIFGFSKETMTVLSVLMALDYSLLAVVHAVPISRRYRNRSIVGESYRKWVESQIHIFFKEAKPDSYSKNKLLWLETSAKAAIAQRFMSFEVFKTLLRNAQKETTLPYELVVTFNQRNFAIGGIEFLTLKVEIPTEEEKE